MTNVRSTASVVLSWLVLEVLTKNRPCSAAVRLEAHAPNSCWASTVPCAGRHKLLLLDVDRPEFFLYSSSKRKPVDFQFTINGVQWYPVVARHLLHVDESAVGRQQAAAAFSSGDMTDCYVRDCKSQGANTRQCFGELPDLVMERSSLWKLRRLGLASLSSGNTFATEAKELETSVETSEHFLSCVSPGPTAEDRRREVDST